jgi:hypothetical protein
MLGLLPVLAGEEGCCWARRGQGQARTEDMRELLESSSTLPDRR